MVRGGGRGSQTPRRVNTPRLRYTGAAALASGVPHACRDTSLPCQTHIRRRVRCFSSNNVGRGFLVSASESRRGQLVLPPSLHTHTHPWPLTHGLSRPPRSAGWDRQCVAHVNGWGGGCEVCLVPFPPPLRRDRVSEFEPSLELVVVCLVQLERGLPAAQLDLDVGRELQRRHHDCQSLHCGLHRPRRDLGNSLTGSEWTPPGCNTKPK